MAIPRQRRRPGSRLAKHRFRGRGVGVGRGPIGLWRWRRETTVVGNSGQRNRYVTTYFRREFEVADPQSLSSLAIELKRDDGAIVYLNGVEIVRSNMPAGTGTVHDTCRRNGARRWLDVQPVPDQRGLAGVGPKCAGGRSPSKQRVQQRPQLRFAIDRSRRGDAYRHRRAFE